MTNSITFPCKVGDTIYDIYEFVHDTPFPNPTMEKWTIKTLGYTYDRRGRFYYSIDGRIIPPEDFGHTIFLSESEALAAIDKIDMKGCDGLWQGILMLIFLKN